MRLFDGARTYALSNGAPSVSINHRTSSRTCAGVWIPSR